MAETWVINENAKIYNIYGKYNILFTSNNENFTAMEFVDLGTPRDPLFELNYYNNGSSTVVADNTTEDESGTYWFNQAYRTVTFETAPTGDLLTWLQANAVKQEEPTTTQNIKIGTSNVDIRIGDTQANKVYIGSDLVWEKSEPEPSGETWVINEFIDLSFGGIFIETNFTSNNESFNKIEVNTHTDELYYYKNSTSISVWDVGSDWTNQAYRTITFETAPTGELLAWLEFNAVKQ